MISPNTPSQAVAETGAPTLVGGRVSASLSSELLSVSTPRLPQCPPEGDQRFPELLLPQESQMFM